MFEASNGNFKKARAVVESATCLNIKGSKDKIVEINQTIDSLEAKNQSLDKENIYPNNSIKFRRKQNSGLKLRGFDSEVGHDIQIPDELSIVPIKNQSKLSESTTVYFTYLKF